MTTMSYVPKSDVPPAIHALATTLRFLGNLVYAIVFVVLLGQMR